VSITFPEPRSKVGIASNVRNGLVPLNGLRHQPVGETNGWYIWAGTELSDAADFFDPLHVEHVARRCPEVLPYLALPPGWRFLIAPGHEDVWFDQSLIGDASGWTTQATNRESEKGLPLALDPLAQSADSKLPAFLARPAGVPVYHGFPILDGLVVDGFRLGIISDSMAHPAQWGDAFIVAPDNSRAGVVWEIGKESPRFEVTRPPENDRWGVYSVWTQHGPTSPEDARRFLAEVVAMLRPIWESTRHDRSD
jgi:hypothetical protein